MQTKTTAGRIIKPLEVLSKVEELHERGLQRGHSTGWPGMDEYITIKPGTTFYLYGQPFSGKSEWWFEVLVNLSCLEGWRHAIFSPETGEAHNIVAELISKLACKPFYSNQHGCLTVQELYQWANFIEEHFLILDAKEDEALTFDDLLSLTDEWELQFGKVHTLTIDPWNELTHDFWSEDRGRQDIYLEKALGRFRRNAIKRNRVNCIITHVTDQQLAEKDGIKFYPKPTPRQIAGGQAYYRKGMNMIGVWRPPVGVMDTKGVPYEENQVILDVSKFKPKGVGKKGEHVMWYDRQRNAYYERGTMQHQYAIRDRKEYQTKTQMLPNPTADDLPF
ncbi:MAG: hypothetical protein ACO1HD_04730 [Bacteroidota bacterium]